MGLTDVEMFAPPEIPAVGDVIFLETTSALVPPGGWTLVVPITEGVRTWRRVVTVAEVAPWPGYSWGVRSVDAPAVTP